MYALENSEIFQNFFIISSNIARSDNNQKTKMIISNMEGRGITAFVHNSVQRACILIGMVSRTGKYFSLVASGDLSHPGKTLVVFKVSLIATS